MEIEKMMIMSTAHISEETNKMLDGDDIDDITLIPNREFGWIIQIPDLETSFGETYSVVPTDLYYCMLYAYKHDCRWLNLDRDGIEYADLKTFDW